MTTTLSSKGQLVIPLELRRRLGLTAGDRLTCEVQEGRIILEREKTGGAKMTMGSDGLPILTAPEGAPEMTPELVKEILAE